MDKLDIEAIEEVLKDTKEENFEERRNMNELVDWAKANSPWLRMVDGEEVTVKYTGHEFIPDAFDPTKKKVRYFLEVEDGSIKFWDTASGKTAFFFGALKEGDYVKISASGEGLKRRYELDLVKDEKQLKEIADDVDEKADK